MNSKPKSWILLVFLGLLAGRSVGEDRYEGAPIHYSDAIPHNPVTELAARLQEQAMNAESMSDREFLDFLLETFHVSPASQVLVFSKTSLQNDLISPQTPRSLFYGPDVYIGWVPGGLMEIAVQDDALGMVFYRVHPPRASRPEFVRDADCLSCHGGSRSLSVPGVMVRSVFPNQDGHPIGSAGSFNVSHETPLENRWGGWYVTGLSGNAAHMGNRIALESEDGRVGMLEGEFTNITSLAPFVNTSAFPSPGSDIVSLMVLEHQVKMQNIINRASLETRLALHREKIMDEFFHESSNTFSETTERILDRQASDVVAYLLFQDEASLPEDGVAGNEAFIQGFQADAQDDREGRSLKDFQLVDRLFKYRCSYMIYSRTFRAMPLEVKSRVWSKLYEVLTATEPPEDFAYLSDLERRRIHQILADTVKDLPTYW